MQKDPILWSYVTLTSLSSKVDREYSWIRRREWTYEYLFKQYLVAANQNVPIVLGLILKTCFFKSKRRIPTLPLWITNSAALGGGWLTLLPMCTSVSSFKPVVPAFKGSFPSKNPDQGESSQSLYLMWVSLREFVSASSQIFSYFSLTSYKNTKHNISQRSFLTFMIIPQRALYLVVLFCNHINWYLVGSYGTIDYELN